MHAPRPQTCTTLPRDQAVVWLSSIHRAAQPDDWPSSARLLDEEEQRRYRAYRFPADARLYLHAHVLLRTTLSRYANVPPEDWRFVFGGHGRPEIATERNTQPGLRFNLSHTSGLAACAVTSRVAVGVDVERLDRPVQTQAIADRYFSRQEAQRLRELPHAQQRVRFLEFWTLKEAYIKACGGGLSIPLDRFSFEHDARGHWRIAFATPRDGVEADWQFVCQRPTLDHVLAVAIHRPGQRDLNIDVRESGDKADIHV